MDWAYDDTSLLLVRGGENCWVCAFC